MIAVASVSGAEDQKKPSEIFSELKIGQFVKLKNHGSCYSISYFEKEIELANTVIEIGEDFVVVRDLAGVKEIRIPVCAIKSVVKIKMEVQ